MMMHSQQIRRGHTLSWVCRGNLACLKGPLLRLTHSGLLYIAWEPTDPFIWTNMYSLDRTKEPVRNGGRFSSNKLEVE